MANRIPSDIFIDFTTNSWSLGHIFSQHFSTRALRQAVKTAPMKKVSSHQPIADFSPSKKRSSIQFPMLSHTNALESCVMWLRNSKLFPFLFFV